MENTTEFAYIKEFDEDTSLIDNDERILLEVAYQLKRIADKMEGSK